MCVCTSYLFSELIVGHEDCDEYFVVSMLSISYTLSYIVPTGYWSCIVVLSEEI